MKMIITISLSMLVFLMGCAGLDPNEANVPDGHDFQFATVVHTAPDITIEVGFYDNFSTTGFYIYFDHDHDTVADFQITCASYGFKVKKRSGPGSFLTVNFTGAPTISGKLYSLTFPVTALELNSPATTHYWLFKIGSAGSSPDRMPDSGYEELSI